MSHYFRTSDGTDLYYKDWGTGPAIIFSHGWPLSSDAFEDQMNFLAQHGFRCIGLDRRGHGRSAQSWTGHTIEQYAQDLHELVEHLELDQVHLVGHSTGGAVVTRYTTRYGHDKVTKLVLLASVTPLMIQRDDFPNGVDPHVFDDMREQILANRSDFYLDFARKFYGYTGLFQKSSEGNIQNFWRIAMQGSLKAHYDCIAAFSETDLRADLEQIEALTLVLYGDKDEIVPPDVCSDQALSLLKFSLEKCIEGAPHGLCSTHKNQVNNALLEFFQSDDF